MEFSVSRLGLRGIEKVGAFALCYTPTMKPLVLAVLLVLAFVVPAWAGFDEGVAAYKSGDYEKAFKEFRALGEGGHVGAQYNVGLMYDNGEGVPQDDGEALKWYFKAAKQGHAYAQVNLGVMYENGQGVSQNYAEALKWYRKTAEQGETIAQAKLAIMYGEGKGVSPDDVQALMWLYLAAAGSSKYAVKTLDLAALDMSPADISKAQRLAREWLEKHEKVE